MQGSRKCRAKVITDVINGQTAIVNIKGQHNHPFNIKRSKQLMLSMRRRYPGLVGDMKIEHLDDQYQDFIIEEDDEHV